MTSTRAFRPRDRANDGRSKRSVIARVSSAGSAGRTRMPFRPCSISSGIPPTAEATTGRPVAIASITEFGNASDRDARTKRPWSRSSAPTSSRWPASRTRASRPSPFTRAASWSPSGPSPTIVSVASGNARETLAKASTTVSWPFSGRSRATVTSRVRRCASAGGWKASRSMPFGMRAMRRARTPSFRSRAAAAEQLATIRCAKA